MRYLQINFHVEDTENPGIKKVWFDIPWMSEEAKAVRYDGKVWKQRILSANYPDISDNSIFLLGTSSISRSERELALAESRVFPWLGVTLENLRHWDRRCSRSSEIYSKEKEDKNSSLVIFGESIMFNSKTQDKFVTAFTACAEDTLRSLFRKL